MSIIYIARFSILVPRVEPQPSPRRGAARYGDPLDLPLAGQMALTGFETKSANGRPPGAPDFVAMVEQQLGRRLARGRPGRKAARPTASAQGG